MTTIYAVSMGTYSDYQIVALFSSKKLAEEYMETFPEEGYSSYNSIEEYTLDPDTANLAKKGYLHWEIQMLRDGTVEEIKSEKLTYDNCDKIRSWIRKRVNAPIFIPEGTPDCFISNVIAKNEQQAIKIVNEQRTQMIANGEWD